MRLRIFNFGFSLLELLVIISIVSILAIISVPVVIKPLLKKRSDNIISHMIAIFDFAKTESIRRGDNVILCASQINSNGVLSGCRTSFEESQLWDEGVLLYVDNNRDGVYNTGDKIKLIEFDKSVMIIGPSNKNNQIGFNSSGEFYNGISNNATYCMEQSFAGIVDYKVQLSINKFGVLSQCVIGTNNCLKDCLAG